MLDLRGKNVWITGASAGLGEALAHSFAKRGARLLLSARRIDRLEAVAKRTGAQVELLPLDLAELDALPGKVEQALSRMGSIDVMVHNAGVGQRAPILETRFEVEKLLMDVNFFGPIALTKALLPSMVAQKRGTFVVVSSVLGLMAVKHRAAYCASKHALHGYFNSLRAELHEPGLRVLMVCPGHLNTEFSRQALEGDGQKHGVDDEGTRKGLSASDCAERTLHALIRGEAEIYPAKWESIGVYLSRFAPGLMRHAVASFKAR